MAITIIRGKSRGSKWRPKDVGPIGPNRGLTNRQCQVARLKSKWGWSTKRIAETLKLKNDQVDALSERYDQNAKTGGK